MGKIPIFIPKKVKRVLLLLHGYGSNGEDMLNLGRTLALSETAIICPNGFDEMGFGGYQWFPLDNDDFESEKIIQQLTQKADRVVPEIQRLVAETCQQVHVPVNQVILGGFSQGGLMVLATAFKTPGIEKVIGMSAVPYDLKKAPVENCPKILLTHGQSDPVVPVQGAIIQAKEMQKMGLSVEVCLSPHLEHGVDDICMQKIYQFIEKK